MIVLIDNYDSFTYNLYQQIATIGEDVIVAKNDELSMLKVKKLKPNKIVISPGPGGVVDSGISREIICTFAGLVPILGVCLGHQCIGDVYGVKIVPAKQLVHGKTSLVRHAESGLFKAIKNPFKVARYHSLALKSVPTDFNLTAWTGDNEIMAIENTKLQLYGVQFHPESFMSESGDTLMRNFIYGT